jgi:hypothetical protein
MNTGTLIIIELAVILGGVLALGFWELRKLKRLRRKREQESAPEDQSRRGIL